MKLCKPENRKDILQWGVYETNYFNTGEFSFPNTQRTIRHCIVVSSKECNKFSSYINIIGYNMGTKKYGKMIYKVTKENIGKYINICESEEIENISKEIRDSFL